MTSEPTTLLGLAALIVSNVGIWVREWRKHRDWKAKNGDVQEIKKDVKTIDGKVDELDTKMAGVEKEIEAFGRTCVRMNGEISTNRNDIKRLIGKMGRKKNRKG